MRNQGGYTNERGNGAADDGGCGTTGSGHRDTRSGVGETGCAAGNAECESGANRGGGRGKHHPNDRAAPDRRQRLAATRWATGEGERGFKSTGVANGAEDIVP